MVVVGKLGNLLDGFHGAAESLEHCTNVSAWLHRNDAKLVLLVDPDKECLVVVVEDASAVGPVTIEVAGLKEAISLPNKNKICQYLT